MRAVPLREAPAGVCAPLEVPSLKRQEPVPVSYTHLFPFTALPHLAAALREVRLRKGAFRRAVSPSISAKRAENQKRRNTEMCKYTASCAAVRGAPAQASAFGIQPLSACMALKRRRR